VSSILLTSDSTRSAVTSVNRTTRTNTTVSSCRSTGRSSRSDGWHCKRMIRRGGPPGRREQGAPGIGPLAVWRLHSTPDSGDRIRRPTCRAAAPSPVRSSGASGRPPSGPLRRHRACRRSYGPALAAPWPRSRQLRSTRGWPPRPQSNPRPGASRRSGADRRGRQPPSRPRTACGRAESSWLAGTPKRLASRLGSPAEHRGGAVDDSRWVPP
jgi:hypothetical protein